MTAAAWYHVRLLGYRQTALAPVLAYLAVLGAVYASDAGPPVPAGSVTAVALMPVSAWLLRLAATAERPPYAEVTAVAVGGRGRLHLARCLAVLVVATGLTGVSLLWAALANPHPYRADTLLTMVGMHLAEATAGVGIGSLVAPPLPVAAGAAVVTVTAVVVVSLVVAWLPPLNPLLRVLDHTPLPGPARIAGAVLQAVATGVVAAGCAVAAGRRR